MYRVSTFMASSVLLLGACGGGSTGDPSGGVSYFGLFDGASTETSALSTLSVDPANGTSGEDADDLDRSADTISLAGLPGTINAARDTITFVGGGTATITNGDTDYVAFYSAEPDSSLSDPFIGTIGLLTDPDDIPDVDLGYSSANGATVIIVDGSDLYELAGAMNVSIDIGTANVNMIFSDLDGTKINSGGTTNVSNVVDINIDGAILSGNSFSGGEATLVDSTLASSLSTDEIVQTIGGLFGPAADEIAGIVTVDDTAEDTLLIIGAFTAD